MADKKKAKLEWARVRILKDTVVMPRSTFEKMLKLTGRQEAERMLRERDIFSKIMDQVQQQAAMNTREARELLMMAAPQKVCTFDATLSPGGRITIPLATVKMAGLQPGMILRVEVKNAMSASVGITQEELDEAFTEKKIRGLAAVAVAADADAKKRRR